MVSTINTDFLYRYRASVVRVIDGDTVVVDCDLGMHVWVHNEHLRLARINAPEKRGATYRAGVEAQMFLSQLLPVGLVVYLRTIKDKQEKYGRYLAEIWLQSNDLWVNVNSKMVEAGHAIYQEY